MSFEMCGCKNHENKGNLTMIYLVVVLQLQGRWEGDQDEKVNSVKKV